MSRPNSSYGPYLVDRDGAPLESDWRLIADDEAADVASVLGFERALRDLAAGAADHVGVRILVGQDVRELAPWLDRIALIEVDFPRYRDGRGYSTARILRQDLGYAGPLRAVGDVLRDQLFLMLRCGFDQFLVKDRDPAEALRWARDSFTAIFQSAADSHIPAWALRHGMTV